MLGLLVCILSLFSLTKSVKIVSSCPPDGFQSAPIEVPEDGLPFCSQYRDKACCSPQDTLKIRDTVFKLMRKECKSCYTMVADWKCAECDPDASKHQQRFIEKLCQH